MFFSKNKLMNKTFTDKVAKIALSALKQHVNETVYYWLSAEV